MYIKEHEFISIKAVNIKKCIYLEKILNKEIKLGSEYKVHWSLLKKSSLRRHKIEVICDGCNQIILKRLQDLNIDASEHFCRSCGKKGDKNGLFGLTGELNPKYGTKVPSITGDNNPAKRLEVREKISKKSRLTNDEFIKRLKERGLFSDKYDFTQINYIDTLTPIKIICEEHGAIEIKPINLISGGSICKLCKNSSKGESKIENILIENKVKYIREKTFVDCRGIKRPLPFDFYLPDYNICIEFDGIQHYKPVERFGGIEGFNEIVKNDNIKNNYCLLNNIKLIRISYKDKKLINYIIQKEL